MDGSINLDSCGEILSPDFHREDLLRPIDAASSMLPQAQLTFRNSKGLLSKTELLQLQRLPSADPIRV